MYAISLSVNQIDKCTTFNMGKEAENFLKYWKVVLILENGENCLVKPEGSFSNDIGGICKKLVWMLFWGIC